MSNKCGKLRLKVVGGKEKIQDKVANLLDQVRKTASKEGIAVSGDSSKGVIDGKKEWKLWGAYSIKADEAKNEATIEIEMEEDHWAVSCNLINEKITKWFKDK